MSTAGKGGKHARNGKGGDASRVDPDAGAPGRFDVAADRIDMAAEDGVAHHARTARRKTCEDEDRQRHAEEAGSGERGEVLADIVGAHMLAGDRGEHGADQQELHADGRDDRIGAGAIDGETVDDADHGAGDQRKKDRQQRCSVRPTGREEAPSPPPS